MNAILLGANSEIGKELTARLHVDGWTVFTWARGERIDTLPAWSLIVCAIGQVAPVGAWHENRDDEWDACMESNLLLPLRLLRELWDRREPDAAVCFLAGSNPNRIMPGYSAYNVSKMALLKAVEQLDAESGDCKLFALGPGYIPTKIHRATHEAGWANDVIQRGPVATMQGVYDCLKWCIAQPKMVIGGRNICASDVRTQELTARLALYPSLYKLRRCE